MTDREALEALAASLPARLFALCDTVEHAVNGEHGGDADVRDITRIVCRELARSLRSEARALGIKPEELG